MNDAMSMTLAALAAESLLLLLALLAASWWRTRRVRQRDAAAIRGLVSRVRQGKDAREAAIEQFLSARGGLSGEALQQAKAVLWRAETLLLQRFIHIYRQRDAAAAARFDDDVRAAVAPYQELPPAGGEGDVGPIDVAELERLRAENQRLSHELRVTVETMSRTINEYSAMFAGRVSPGTVPVPPADTDPAPAGAVAGGQSADPAETNVAGGEGPPVAAGEGPASEDGVERADAVPIEPVSDTQATVAASVAEGSDPRDADPVVPLEGQGETEREPDRPMSSAAHDRPGQLEEGPVEVVGCDDTDGVELGDAEPGGLFDPLQPDDEDPDRSTVGRAPDSAEASGEDIPVADAVQRRSARGAA